VHLTCSFHTNLVRLSREIDADIYIERSDLELSLALSRNVIPSRASQLHLVRFGVFTAVTMKNGVFWDVTPRGSCKNRSFGGT
jgi:hypothetical protein